MATRSTEDGIAATITDRLADRLRRDILGGRFAPGKRLKIADFALLYGLSHMPVREALRRLEGEGLIDVIPFRGAAVRTIDATFINSIYDVREALEGILTERCAERAGRPDVERLERANADFVNAATRGQAGALLECNRRFHAIIFEVAANPEASRILETGRILIESLRRTLGRNEARIAAIIAQHAGIVAAIRSRDALRAGALARAHVAQARDDLIERFARAGGVTQREPMQNDETSSTEQPPVS